MLVYFATLAVLGVTNIVAYPGILGVAQPVSGRSTSSRSIRPRRFLALGSVVLAVTGAETLYADMGHFGRKAIGLSLADAGLSLPDAQLYGPGRAAARPTPTPSAIPSS